MRDISGVHARSRLQSRIAKSPLLDTVSTPALQKTGKPYRIIEL